MIKDDVIKELALKFSEHGIDICTAKNILYIGLNDYTITQNQKMEIVEYSQSENDKAFKMFMVSKKVEGCTDRTIKFYRDTLNKYNSVIVKPYTETSTNDIRYYLAYRETQEGVSKCTVNNERRVLSTFFTWLTANDYIVKNPMLAIKPIKQEKRIKKPFSEEELEMIRRSCKDKREIALVEFLYSTGCRCGEIEGLLIENVDIASGKLIVFGKGQKEREVFLNAKCRMTLKEYLDERDNPQNGPLFAIKIRGKENKGMKSVNQQWVENTIKKIGDRAGVGKCHPHRFRRTTATTALNRGMPIEQVRMMLGHENISTTTIYAIADKENLQYNHKKYVV